MNTKKLRLKDLMLVTQAIVNAKVRSDKLYGFIVRYALNLATKDTEWTKNLVPNVPIFFFFSLAKAYPSLDNEPEFFQLVDTYLES